MKEYIKSTLFKWLKKNNLLPQSIIDASVLDKGRGLEKQLDEYR
ncbi:hypothetical protein [Photobacterium phosphoreum]|nr:hypothetical protein [Photobacterium phosphoreum]